MNFDFNEFVNELEEASVLGASPGTTTKIEFSDPIENHRSFSVVVRGQKKYLIDVRPYPYER